MPNYKVRIRWTDWGLNPNNPDSVDERIQHAIEAAGRHKVKGRNGDPLDRNHHRHDEGDHLHVTWHLHGTDTDVQALINRWNGRSDGTGYPAFTPNVEVLEWHPE